MKNWIFAAALFAAFNSAQAQTIEVITACETAPRAINFDKVALQSEKKEPFRIGSQCPSQELPRFRLPEGNYMFEDLPKREGETWFYKIERNGKALKKGELIAPFLTYLQNTDKLTIIIAAPIKCNCSDMTAEN
jgi:hypothetical protein